MNESKKTHQGRNKQTSTVQICLSKHEGVLLNLTTLQSGWFVYRLMIRSRNCIFKWLLANARTKNSDSGFRLAHNTGHLKFLTIGQSTCVLKRNKPWLSANRWSDIGVSRSRLFSQVFRFYFGIQTSTKIGSSPSSNGDIETCRNIKLSGLR